MGFLENAQTYFPSLDSQFGLLALLFFAVLLTVFGGVGLVRARDPIQRRLANGTSTETSAVGGYVPLHEAGDGKGSLKRLEKYWTPQNDSDRSQVRERLFRAGYRRPSAVRTYYAIRTVFGLIVPITVGFIFPLISRDIDTKTVILLTGILIAVGFYLPMLWVMRQAERRQVAVRDGFPDALDMLLVCVEAGLGLDAALDRVAREIAPGHPIVAEELTLCGLELRAGKGRLEVLRDFAKRIAIDDIRAFVAVLTQSDQYGTSMAQAIRVYSAEMRDKRFIRAEEKANKLPTKLALGAILFTLPPVFMIMISPALVSVFKFLTLLTE